ncbi:MAG TPA: NAD(P)H-hydrate epimerase [Elusimicrobia bacterium]|jgi:NAD(P)H-hydrate epimerase|nr:NAD(P)H-hydrate epimerase [Elusimicrobiota bacterium]
MDYLTVKEINEIDRLASKKYGIPSIILMENAGRAVAEETIKTLKRQIPRYRRDTKTQKIAIFCGSGKNGGDGFVSARYLFNHGYMIEVYLLKNPTKISGDSLTNFTILKKIGIKTKLVSVNIFSNLSHELKSVDCIIDALFGTGLKGKIEGLPAQLIKLINQTKKSIISIDIPSGLDADTGFSFGECIKATVTVTMGYPKKGFPNPQAKKFLAKLIIADIGYPKQLKGR